MIWSAHCDIIEGWLTSALYGIFLPRAIRESSYQEPSGPTEPIGPIGPNGPKGSNGANGPNESNGKKEQMLIRITLSFNTTFNTKFNLILVQSKKKSLSQAVWSHKLQPRIVGGLMKCVPHRLHLVSSFFNNASEFPPPIERRWTRQDFLHLPQSSSREARGAERLFTSSASVDFA